MSKAIDLEMPRKQPPNGRDREIYEAVMCGNERQAEVAKRYGVSQSRVAQIVQRVEDWMQQVLGSATSQDYDAAAQRQVEQDDAAAAPEPNDGEERELTNKQRLSMAEGLAYERVEYLYHASLAAWKNSLEDSKEERMRKVGGELVTETITKSQTGKCAYLNQALRAATASARLMGVDMTGKERRMRAEAERLAEVAARQAGPTPATPVQPASEGALPAADQAQPRPVRTANNSEDCRAISTNVEADEVLESISQELAASLDQLLKTAA